MNYTNFRLIALLFSLLTLAACSDYPTNGFFVSDDSDNTLKFQNFEGIIVELKPQIYEELNELYKSKNQDIKAFNVNMTLLDPDKNIINKKSVKALNKQYLTEMGNYKKQAVKIYDAWYEDILNKLKTSQESLDGLSEKLAEFQTYTIEYETKIKNIETTIEKNKEQTQQILEEILIKTNELIIESKKPIKQLKPGYFSLRSSSKTWQKDLPQNCRKVRRWGKSYKEYKLDDYIVIDQLDTEKKCTYINRPKKGIVSDDYDKFVIAQYFKSEKYENKKLKDELREVNKQLRDASIIASNQTGVKYNSLKRELKENEKQLKYFTQLAEKITIDDFLSERSYLHIAEKLNLNSYMAFEELQSINTQLKQVNPNSQNINSTYVSKIHEFYDAAINDIIESNTKEITKVKNNGYFNGLDGSYGFLMAIAQFDMTVSIANQSTTEKSSIIELININDENHPLANEDKLNITITNRNMHYIKKGTILDEDLKLKIMRQELKRSFRLN